MQSVEQSITTSQRVHGKCCCPYFELLWVLYVIRTCSLNCTISTRSVPTTLLPRKRMLASTSTSKSSYISSQMALSQSFRDNIVNVSQNWTHSMSLAQLIYEIAVAIFVTKSHHSSMTCLSYIKSARNSFISLPKSNIDIMQ